MDAIVTAGGLITPDDPLYGLAPVEKKALIPLAGKVMVSWVIDALLNSTEIDNIIIVGLKRHELDYHEPRLHFVDSAGDLVDNIFIGVNKLQVIQPSVKKFLLVSSDIPLITPEIVRGFIEECGNQEAHLYYAVVEEKTMEARFPHSKRTYIPFKGGRYTGGDVFLFDIAATNPENFGLAKSLTSSRKNYLTQARLIGFDFIFRFLLRSMTVHEAARRASAKVNLDGRAVDTRYAELGMDLDKPHQYEMIKTCLEEPQVRPHHPTLAPTYPEARI
jgi:GTP:adenosylcobinamide-phosphate guanylyltransferase